MKRYIQVLLIILFVFMSGCGLDSQKNKKNPSDFLVKKFLNGEVQRTSEPRVYVGSYLYEYINGGSELYHKYEFTEVATSYYKMGSLELVVDVYQFVDSIGSFGLYSMLRPAVPNFTDIGVEGYSTNSSVEFTKGSLIVRITSFTENDDAVSIMNKMAIELEKEISGSNKYPDMFSCFIDDNVIPHSRKIYSQSFLGYNFMTDVYKQDCILNDDTFQVFVAADVFQQKFNDWLKKVQMTVEDSVIISDYDFDDGGEKGIIVRDTYYGDILAGRKNGKLVGIVNFNSSQSGYLDVWLKYLENKKRTS